MSELKYRSVLICEDIRQEINGRVSLMGVLAAKLFVTRFPFKFLKLCLFIEWEEVVGKWDVGINIVKPSGLPLLPKPLAASIEGQPGLTARSMIVLENFEFPEAGAYKFEFTANGTSIGCEHFTLEKFEPAPQVMN
ncbi:MAG TPA: hypothetical protein VIV61_18515 [Candidatus Ozemobacteraceae bacterium]